MRRGRRVITPIDEVARSVGNYVDIIGIVVEFGFHRMCRGPDFVCPLKIIDHTRQFPEFTVVIFGAKLEFLPVFKSPRDVIVLHSVRIDMHDGEPNAVFNKEKSSFGLFDGNNSDDFFCYQALNDFSLSLHEMDYLKTLRNWLPSAHIHSGNGEYLMSIGDLSEDTYFDLFCKVLHVSYDVEKGIWILFVWDGTDAPLLSLNGKINDELPLQFESIPLHQSVLYKSKRVGTILRVMADENHKNLDMQFLGVGKWVRLRSMAAKVSAGMWIAALNTQSRVRLLPDNDNIVVDCKRKFDERISSHGRLPLWRNFGHDLTAVECDEMESFQFMTLMDVLAYKEDDVTFYCVVRVVMIDPFPTLNGCETAFRLTLEDPTARINVLLHGEELVIFFNELPRDVLLGKMKDLLGVPQHQNVNDNGCFTRFPPLVKCCIGTSRDALGNRLYSICRTKLI